MHLDLHDQMGAALEIQPEPDIALDVFHHVGPRFGDVDDAEHANQKRYGNDHCAHGCIFFHGKFLDLLNRLLLLARGGGK